MRINFNAAGIPVKNAFVNPNFSPIKQKSVPKFNSSSDVFVKSVPAFGSNPNYELRRDVIANGVDGIISCLTLYLNPCTSANKHRMPSHEDFDDCMDKFFLLSCAASSVYATQKGGVVKYPNEEEFVDILQTLWAESEGPAGADVEKYRTNEILRLDERGRMNYMYDFIKDDIGRAMSVYSQQKYDKPLETMEDVKEFALKIYDDKTTRTIKPRITRINKAKIRHGEMSKYALELASQPSSACMIDYLLQNKNRFFSEPKSIRQRYEDTLPRERVPIFKEGNPYDDDRTDFEKAIDQMIGMPW